MKTSLNKSLEKIARTQDPSLLALYIKEISRAEQITQIQKSFSSSTPKELKEFLNNDLKKISQLSLEEIKDYVKICHHLFSTNINKLLALSKASNI